jgi:membrane associated rhomboid family serine protease
MGIYDRDYYRAPQRRGGFAQFDVLSITTWLVLINVAVFLLDLLVFQRPRRSGLPPEIEQIFYRRSFEDYMGPLSRWGYFSYYRAITQLQLWRFISFQFLHASLGHLFGNMLSLYLFGPIVESYLGRMRYLAFYLVCGIAGALSYLILFRTGHLVSSPTTPLVGASAGIFGILVAAAYLAPDVRVMLLFPPIPMKLRYMAIVMLGIAVYTVFTQGMNAGGEAAHIGGGVLGWAIIAGQRWLNSIAMRRRVQKDWTSDFDR